VFGIIVSIMILLGGTLFYLQYRESDRSVKSNRNAAFIMWVGAVGFMYKGIFTKDGTVYSLQTRAILALMITTTLILFIGICMFLRKSLFSHHPRRNL